MPSGRKTGLTFVVVACLVLSLIAAHSGAGKQSLTAYFTESKGIYVGDDVTVLGVPVGKITDITPQRKKVRVRIEVDGDQKIPADARAAIVSKSLVSVRSIVIAPVYDSGPTLKDDGVIPLSRTTVPVEWDEVKDELVRLTEALGPNGANRDGATSELVSSTAAYLNGKGTNINTTIKDLAAATQTLADNKGDTFATVHNLEVFVRALRSSDVQVRSFETQLANASGVLDGNKAYLAKAVAQFRGLTLETKDFFASNADILATTLTSLQSTTSVLSKNRQSVADLLQIAPTVASNFYNIIDPRASALTGELGIANFGDPAYLICSGLFALGGSTTDCRQALGPLVQYLKVSAPPIGANPASGNGVGPGGAASPDDANTLGSSQSAPGSTTNDADLLSQLSSKPEGKR